MQTNNRAISPSIQALLARFPAVVVLGARQVGKSTLLRALLPDAKCFDLERRSDYQRLSDDPELVFSEHSGPLIFDEAQLAPALFSALRVAIDADRQTNGRFLISGSSSPALLHHVSESLAGRCAVVELSGFSWDEGLQRPASDFFSLLLQDEPLPALKRLAPRFSHRELIDLCLSGAYPEPFLKRDDALFFDQWMESYLKTYVERDIRRLFPTLNLDAYQRFIRMLCYASGEMINLSNFARSLDVSQPTVKKYMDIMEGTFMWRSLKSHEVNYSKSVVKMPKGYVRDTGLLCHLLNIHSLDDLKSHPKYGHIWECFVIEQVLKGLDNQLIPFRAEYFRTRSQAEIDLILLGRFGLIPIEIKASYTTPKRQLLSMEEFINKNACPFGIVINQGEEIFMLSERIIQIPALYL